MHFIRYKRGKERGVSLRKQSQREAVVMSGAGKEEEKQSTKWGKGKRGLLGERKIPYHEGE